MCVAPKLTIVFSRPAPAGRGGADIMLAELRRTVAHRVGGVAGLRQRGIVAPLVPDGRITGTACRAYVEPFLAPALAPGDVVVLANLAAHKVTGVRQTITAAGASGLDLPPYSPDLNPIEQLFAKRKALLRKPQPAPGPAGVHHRSSARDCARRPSLPLSEPLRLWFHLKQKCSGAAAEGASRGRLRERGRPKQSPPAVACGPVSPKSMQERGRVEQRREGIVQSEHRALDGWNERTKV
jgi:transposase